MRQAPYLLGEGKVFGFIIVFIIGYHNISDVSEINRNIGKDNIISALNNSGCFTCYIIVQIVPDYGDFLHISEGILCEIRNGEGFFKFILSSKLFLGVFNIIIDIFFFIFSKPYVVFLRRAL